MTGLALLSSLTETKDARGVRPCREHAPQQAIRDRRGGIMTEPRHQAQRNL